MRSDASRERKDIASGPTSGPTFHGLEPAGVHSEADDELDGLHLAFAASGEPALRDELMARYDGLAVGLVRQFRTQRETFDDLAQVARLGLLHAVDRFDPHRGRPFGPFARMTIIGELKRHVRDKTWAMGVPRSLQEHFLLVIRSADELTAHLGRSPRIPEIAQACGLTEDQVLEATDLLQQHRPTSLDAPQAAETKTPPEPGVTDTGYEQVENHSTVIALLSRLSRHERDVLELYFVDGMTQTQVADTIGMSQMYVSRLISRVLARLRVLDESGAGRP